MNGRICIRCGEEKPLEEFWRRKNDSLAKWCRDCRAKNGRLHGRGYGSEEEPIAGPEGLYQKWVEYRDRLRAKRDEMGMGFSFPARVQLGLAEQFVEDLERTLNLTSTSSQAAC